MNKKSISILLIVFSIISICLLSNFSNELKKGDLKSLKKSAEEINNILSTRKEANKNLINTLLFDGNELFYDSKNKCFYYSLIKDNSNANNPFVGWDNSNVEIAFEDIDINSKNISSNKKIRIVIYSANEYNECYLVCTTLPLININTLDIASGKYADMKVTVFDNEIEKGYIIKDYSGKIHTRGGSSLSYPKNGFRIKLRLKEVEKQDREISLFGFDKTDEYVLYSIYNDQEKIRNVFSSKLWYEGCSNNNSLGITNGMYYKYVELFVNKEYWGLYAIGLPIDARTENIDSSDIVENIYKKVSWRNEYDIDFNDIGKVGGYEIKTNESNIMAWNGLRDFYKNIFDCTNPKNLYDLVDIENSIDLYLFFSMIQANDSVKGEDIKNFYLINKKKDDGTIMLYCPWDMDDTWGNYWENEAYNYTREYYYEPNADFPYMKINVVQYLLDNNDDQIKDLIKNRYDYLRKHEWSDENILNILNEYEQDIFESGAYLRDKDKWPDGDYIDGDYKLSKFKEYVIERTDYYDECIAKLVN